MSVSVPGAGSLESNHVEKTETGQKCKKGGWTGGRTLLEKILFLMSKCPYFIVVSCLLSF